MNSRIITFREAILAAQEFCLQDRRAFIIGEGVPDPKAIFGTTVGLKDKYPMQVFDSPISENGVTGVCIGSAINGLRPILIHQRMDFSLYSADQIINVSAKWFSMFGGQTSVPLVIRMIIGRGWGQGNQHSQNLTSLYAHVPGLKIVMPSNAYDAKGLFISSVKDDNPVLFIEHRWLHETTSEVPEEPYEIPIGKALVKELENPHVTVVSSGHATLETKIAIEFLFKRGVRITHIDLRSIRPLDIETIKRHVLKSGRLVVVDDAWGFGGLASEIITRICEDETITLKASPKRVTYPNFPSASSPHLTKKYYPGPVEIAVAITKTIDDRINLLGLKMYQKERIHDVPDLNFRGPF